MFDRPTVSRIWFICVAQLFMSFPPDSIICIYMCNHAAVHSSFFFSFISLLNICNGWIHFPHSCLLLVSLWCGCQSKQVKHLLIHPGEWVGAELMPAFRTAIETDIPGGLGAGSGLPWSTTICLGQRVLWCWTPGIFQHVFMLLTHNV